MPFAPTPTYPGQRRPLGAKLSPQEQEALFRRGGGANPAAAVAQTARNAGQSVMTGGDAPQPPKPSALVAGYQEHVQKLFQQQQPSPGAPAPEFIGVQVAGRPGKLWRSGSVSYEDANTGMTVMIGPRELERRAAVAAGAPAPPAPSPSPPAAQAPAAPSQPPQPAWLQRRHRIDEKRRKEREAELQAKLDIRDRYLEGQRAKEAAKTEAKTKKEVGDVAAVHQEVVGKFRGALNRTYTPEQAEEKLQDALTVAAGKGIALSEESLRAVMPTPEQFAERKAKKAAELDKQLRVPGTTPAAGAKIVRAALQKGWITQEQANNLPIPPKKPTQDETRLTMTQMREVAQQWIGGKGEGTGAARGLVPHLSFAEYQTKTGQAMSAAEAERLVMKGGEYIPRDEIKPQKYVGLERGYRRFAGTLGRLGYTPEQARGAWIAALLPHQDLVALWLKKHPSDANEVQKQSANAPSAPALPPSYPQPTEEEYRSLGGGSSRPG